MVQLGGHHLRECGRGLGAGDGWAEAFASSFQGLTRDEVAGRLQIMQPPVDQRRRPGWYHTVQEFLK